MYYRVNEDEEYHGMPHVGDIYDAEMLAKRKQFVTELGILKTLHDMYNSTEGVSQE